MGWISVILVLAGMLSKLTTIRIHVHCNFLDRDLDALLGDELDAGSVMGHRHRNLFECDSVKLIKSRFLRGERYLSCSEQTVQNNQARLCRQV